MAAHQADLMHTVSNLHKRHHVGLLECLKDAGKAQLATNAGRLCSRFLAGVSSDPLIKPGNFTSPAEMSCVRRTMVASRLPLVFPRGRACIKDGCEATVDRLLEASLALTRLELRLRHPQWPPSYHRLARLEVQSFLAAAHAVPSYGLPPSAHQAVEIVLAVPLLGVPYTFDTAQVPERAMQYVMWLFRRVRKMGTVEPRMLLHHWLERYLVRSADAGNLGAGVVSRDGRHGRSAPPTSRRRRPGPAAAALAEAPVGGGGAAAGAAAAGAEAELGAEGAEADAGEGAEGGAASAGGAPVLPFAPRRAATASIAVAAAAVATSTVPQPSARPAADAAAYVSSRFVNSTAGFPVLRVLAEGTASFAAYGGTPRGRLRSSGPDGVPLLAYVARAPGDDALRPPWLSLLLSHVATHSADTFPLAAAAARISSQWSQYAMPDLGVLQSDTAIAAVELRDLLWLTGGPAGVRIYDTLCVLDARPATLEVHGEAVVAGTLRASSAAPAAPRTYIAYQKALGGWGIIHVLAVVGVNTGACVAATAPTDGAAAGQALFLAEHALMKMTSTRADVPGHYDSWRWTNVPLIVAVEGMLGAVNLLPNLTSDNPDDLVRVVYNSPLNFSQPFDAQLPLPPALPPAPVVKKARKRRGAGAASTKRPSTKRPIGRAAAAAAAAEEEEEEEEEEEGGGSSDDDNKFSSRPVTRAAALRAGAGGARAGAAGGSAAGGVPMGCVHDSDSGDDIGGVDEDAVRDGESDATDNPETGDY